MKGAGQSFNTTPEGSTTQYLRSLVPKTILLMVFGTRVLKYWVLGRSGYPFSRRHALESLHPRRAPGLCGGAGVASALPALFGASAPSTRNCHLASCLVKALLFQQMNPQACQGLCEPVDLPDLSGIEGTMADRAILALEEHEEPVTSESPARQAGVLAVDFTIQILPSFSLFIRFRQPFF